MGLSADDVEKVCRSNNCETCAYTGCENKLFEDMTQEELQEVYELASKKGLTADKLCNLCQCVSCDDCGYASYCHVSDFTSMTPEELYGVYRKILRLDTEEIKPIQPDNVNPKHYKECSIECIDMMILVFGRYRTADWCDETAFKYLWRHENKNWKEDIDKCEWYLSKAEELRGTTKNDIHDRIVELYEKELKKYVH